MLTSNIDFDAEERAWPCPHRPGKFYTREGAAKQIVPEADGSYTTYHRHTDRTMCHLERADFNSPWTLEGGPI